MLQLLLGAAAMGCAVAGLLLLRAYRRHGDRLLPAMAVAFWILGLHWLILGIPLDLSEHHPLIYGMRLAAFVVLGGAVLDKNWPYRAPTRMHGPGGGGRGEGLHG
jgi:hypothetical protein